MQYSSNIQVLQEMH